MVIVFGVGFLLYPRIIDCRSLSLEEEAEINIKIYKNVVEDIKKDIGHYPESRYGLKMVYQNLSGDDNWRGLYLGRVVEPLDGWGNNLIYRYPAKCFHYEESYELYSTGENGVDECQSGDDVTFE